MTNKQSRKVQCQVFKLGMRVRVTKFLSSVEGWYTNSLMGGPEGDQHDLRKFICPNEGSHWLKAHLGLPTYFKFFSFPNQFVLLSGQRCGKRIFYEVVQRRRCSITLVGQFVPQFNMEVQVVRSLAFLTKVFQKMALALCYRKASSLEGNWGKNIRRFTAISILLGLGVLIG